MGDSVIEAISDLLLVAGSFGLAAYCWVLSRRLAKLSRSDEGLGAAIGALSEKVDALRESVTKATAEADGSAERLGELIQDADRHEAELSVLLAGLSDMDELRERVAASTADAPGAQASGGADTDAADTGSDAAEGGGGDARDDGDTIEFRRPGSEDGRGEAEEDGEDAPTAVFASMRKTVAAGGA